MPVVNKRRRPGTNAATLVLPAACALITVSVIVAAGCGGGGTSSPLPSPSSSSPSPSPTPSSSPVPTVTPRLTVLWAERSRGIDLSKLTSALSLVVRLRAAGTTGDPITLTINRDANLAAHQTIHLASAPLPVGAIEIQADLYAGPDGTGDRAGVVSGIVGMDAAGNLPTLTASGVVTAVELSAGQAVRVSERKDLGFVARDAESHVLILSPGSAQFRLASADNSYLQLSGGLAEGKLPGTATVIATVDGIDSAPTPVQVVTDITVQVAPSPVTVGVGGTVNFQATLGSLPNGVDNGVTWKIEPGTADGSSIGSDGVFRAGATPGTCTVVASSRFDPTRQTRVSVTVVSGDAEVGVDFPPSGDAEVILQ